MRLKSLLLAAALAAGWAVAQAETQYTNIGTGGLTGVYYPTGGAICRMMNKTRDEHHIRCSVESTGGSVYNLNAIANGELDFGIAQSDWQYHAYHGDSKFAAKGPNPDLRAVFSLHAEPFTVVARQEAAIHAFADLKGKRVNVGNPGSGQRATLEVLLDALGWDLSIFKLAAEQKASEQSQALCDNKIDAFVYTVGHPNASIEEAATTCDTNLVAVEGPAVDKLVTDHPFYAKAIIPGGMYRGTDRDVPTFGVKATLVSSAKVPEATVYALVKAVFENFEEFRGLHPAFAHLEPAQMLEGNSAPFHPGALKYYRERGWIK